MQDTYLVKLKIHEVHRITKKYIAIISFGVSLGITVLYVNEIWIFPIYLMVIGIILLSLQVKNMGNDVLVMAPNKLTK